ncbi:hypothetical protein DJ568_04735 [Mucilaginibacter hurinus]|uniref:Cytochrome c domain-containing protein n=1 Tax=Mucilaginibacter hurinus TaxID=2201324 RepID=A0A367GRH2_9SPHI|nr:ThuA domain-containing protein [Mucilaginibacter hurinus]RCH56057.1 hypothetical protein DJ568_04735 [Mucilaginibacter hurinus]
MRNLLLDLQSSKTLEHNKKTLTLLFLAVGLLSVFTLGSGHFSPGGNNAASFTPAAAVDGTADEIPDIQVFIPGYSVRELPLSLNQINVLKYGDDGRLYGLGYNGHVYALTDTDGDGLEDKAVEWWNGEKGTLAAPVGMAVTPAGIYVTAKNKVSLLKDTDKDGIGDTEEIVTKDWVRAKVYTGTTEGGVDAFGIAKDKDGNIFFALGTADFTRPYAVDSLGISRYDIKSQRGTILKVKPGSNEREIYCTGTRFPVAMDFNEQGDLFCTDQEGATWPPANGNPFDELLHIQPDRHYGYPPRHPKYLPNVIDEPSVFDYKPQHVSTTGIHFNLPVNGGPVFQADWARNDAIVCGFSRGKIYRTKLHKTPSGYVAVNSLIASCKYLTVDAAITPTGDLVVSTHSGPPDWGWGAAAKGKLYKIMRTNKEVPNPVMAYVAKQDQVKVAFDKPLPAAYLAGLADKIKIEFGEPVAAGDRFEFTRPGYKEVFRQRLVPVEKMGVKNVSLSDDRKTLLVNTFRHLSPVGYGITLPAFTNDVKSANSIKQSPDIDMAYNLNGIDVKWEAGGKKWEGNIPHLDLNVSKEFLKPTSEYTGLEQALNTPGKLVFKTRLNLNNMLRPEIQPESTIDYKLPPEDVTLVFKSSEPVTLTAAGGTVSSPVKQGDGYETRVTFKAVEKKGYDLEVAANTTRKFTMEVHYFTNEDSRPRALQIFRFFAPWAKDIFPKEPSGEREIPELAGGNWERGKKLFFGQALCSNCHTYNGKGQTIGPDLSNSKHRDYASVLRDIHEPNASINPDYVAHTVTLKNKKTYLGVLSYTKDSLSIRDAAGVRTTVALKSVAETKPYNGSIMPTGLDAMLGPQKMKDLMTFLLTNIGPAKIEHVFVPQIRSPSEVQDVLRNFSQADNLSAKPKVAPKKSPAKRLGVQPKPFRILWVSGPKDHGPDEHDYPLQQQRMAKILMLMDNVVVTKVSKWPTQEQLNNADVAVFYWNYQQFNEDNSKQLEAFQQRGGGLVYLHYGVDATQNPVALANRIGLAWKGGQSKFRHGRLDLQFTPAAAAHPVTRGFKKPLVLEDESYWVLTPGSRKIDILATSMEDKEPQPMVWTSTEGNGRVFVSIMGHYNWTFDDPLFRVLLFRGLLWAGHQPLDRFNDVVTIGTRMTN